MKIYIYAVKFEDKVVYVGQTFQDPKHRWWKHQSAARRGRNHCPKLYNHMRKHGLDNYTFEVIETCKVEISEEREKFWIAHYNTFHNGLNCHPGGNQTRGKYHYSYGIQPKKAVKASVASRLGTKHSAEHVEKIRAAHIGRKQPQNYIAITCDQNGKTYEKIQDAEDDLKICGISSYLKGKVSAVSGYTFKYVDESKETARVKKVLRPHWTKESHPDAIKKMSEAKKLFYQKNPEAKERLRVAAAASTARANAKRAIKIKRSDGIEFSSVAEAARSINGVSFDYARTRIRRSLKDRSEFMGFIWSK